MRCGQSHFSSLHTPFLSGDASSSHVGLHVKLKSAGPSLERQLNERDFLGDLIRDTPARKVEERGKTGNWENK